MRIWKKNIYIYKCLWRHVRLEKNPPRPCDCVLCSPTFRYEDNSSFTFHPRRKQTTWSFIRVALRLLTCSLLQQVYYILTNSFFFVRPAVVIVFIYKKKKKKIVYTIRLNRTARVLLRQRHTHTEADRRSKS